MEPRCRVSQYQRHVDIVLNFREAGRRLSDLPTAINRKRDAMRSWQDLPVAPPPPTPPRSSLETELDENPELASNIADHIPDESSSEASRNHPVALSQEDAWPIVFAVYPDGMNSDNVSFVWVYDLRNDLRHLCIAIRKSCTCACGCRDGAR